MKYEKTPTICNICGGTVKYVNNSLIYGKEYGSGWCYFCINCNAYVGTHEDSPETALGILANREMREMKMKCHALFDKKWKNHKQRTFEYRKLASRLHIPLSECHFGYFDMEMLNRAYKILEREETHNGRKV